MHSNKFFRTDVSFPTQTAKQDKPPSLSDVTTLQVGKAVTHIDSTGTWVPAVINNFIICTIYGDPMYLIEGTPNKTHQVNIDYPREPSNPNMFLSIATF